MNKNLKVVLVVVCLLCILGSCSKMFASPSYIGTWEVVDDTGSTHEWMTFNKDTVEVNGSEYDIEVDEDKDSTIVYVKDDNGDIQMALYFVFDGKDKATVSGMSSYSDSETFDVVRK